MLIGEYQHTLDPKGRVNFPARLRESLGSTFIITKGLDNCLYVYSMEEWKVLEDKIRALPMSKSRNLQRFFFAGAAEAEPDKQGRVLIPAHLREYAGLTKDVTVIGASVRAEIWDSERYQSSCEELTSDSIAESMDELGF
ncbi:division/cell wall cluster transcriptional repressor MraZ [Merdimmobilis hominis]|jgi:MraZ protein|uniref:Transcriptional regulator MraZ n=1 Tax=uncultured Anaerotruncus sp. TaxID=905011 RepID=A0A6N2T4I3_9FIRM|nr:division/cell wall cluster transcriptional repressor MraZ [Merdimmobilis hominis]MCD4835981.1 division/cell wall cluster transcriptional repressor MraZ [Merdimmobilis hominis]